MEIKSTNIELVSVDQLVPYEKNMNQHTDEQIDRLIKLIEYQGFRDPIIAQKGTNRVAAGHGRLVAAKKMGLEKVPVTYQEFESEDQFYAFVVSHNAIAKDSWASLDLSMVNAELENLGPIDIDLLGLKDFVVEPIEKLDPGCDEDEVPEVEHAITRRGDVWLLGEHRVMCGDSTMIDDVDKLMNGKKADAVYTDPPYGINLNTDNSKMHQGGNTYKKVANDDEDFDPRFMLEYFNECKEVFLWGFNYFANYLPSGTSHSFIVWDKSIKGQDGIMTSDFELCWSKNKHSNLIYRKFWKGYRANENGEKRVHPTQKPIEMFEWFAGKWLENCNLVSDLFLGSGSTLIACEKTNRKCYGMELDEHYCDVIVKRWEKYTGKTATLESTGQTYQELENERQD